MPTQETFSLIQYGGSMTSLMIILYDILHIFDMFGRFLMNILIYRKSQLSFEMSSFTF